MRVYERILEVPALPQLVDAARSLVVAHPSEVGLHLEPRDVQVLIWRYVVLPAEIVNGRIRDGLAAVVELRIQDAVIKGQLFGVDAQKVDRTAAIEVIALIAIERRLPDVIAITIVFRSVPRHIELRISYLRSVEPDFAVAETNVLVFTTNMLGLNSDVRRICIQPILVVRKRLIPTRNDRVVRAVRDDVYVAEERLLVLLDHLDVADFRQLHICVEKQEDQADARHEAQPAAFSERRSTIVAQRQLDHTVWQEGDKGAAANAEFILVATVRGHPHLVILPLLHPVKRFLGLGSVAVKGQSIAHTSVLIFGMEAHSLLRRLVCIQRLE